MRQIDEAKNDASDEEEEKNIWFLIAKANKSIKEVPNNKPVTTTNNKSASRIGEMLESLRRRMSAVTTGTPTIGSYQSVSSSSSSGINLIDSNVLEQYRNQKLKPKSVLEAIDFHDLESLFCLNNQPNSELSLDESTGNFIRRLSVRTNASSDSVISSNSYSNESHDEEGADGDLSLELIENILDSKKSLNINIFLKQIKSQDDLIEQINSQNHSKVGKERLEILLKLLPDESEREQLMRFFYRNKQNRLPIAERFLFELTTRISNLKLKIKFMLLQEKYHTDLVDISPQLDKIDEAIREIRKSKKFRDLLNLVLVTGNFLNSGGYAADAAGFGLDCLDRLNEIRSNKEGIYLIHYIAEIGSKMSLIDFLKEELPHLECASRVCLESTKLEINSMMDKIQELKCDTDKEIDLIQEEMLISSNQSNNISIRSEASEMNKPPPPPGTSDRQFLLNLLRTLDVIKSQLELLNKRLTIDLDGSRKKLADYLCEDPDTFKLHDCFKTILTFSQRLKVASDENERRQRLEMSRFNCNLRRSNTINARLPRTSYLGGNTAATNKLPLTSSRQSLGGLSISSMQSMASSLSSSASGGGTAATAANFQLANFNNNPKTRASLGANLPSERPSSSSMPFGRANMMRTSSIHNVTSIKSHNNNCQASKTSAITKTSSDNKSDDYDDLHEGLMKLLTDTNSANSRRHSQGFGSSSYRRASRLFGATASKVGGPTASKLPLPSRGL